MKTYFTIIKRTQSIMMVLSVLILIGLPELIVYVPESTTQYTTAIYFIAHISLFLVMIVRPLADILRGVKWIRPLVILRKGFGVFSASLIVSFMLSKIIVDPTGFFTAFGTPAYWSVTHMALLAHCADISAVLLLITSNQLSKKILGVFWKRIQKLSYVYFFASGLYVTIILNDMMLPWFMSTVIVLTTTAFIMNRNRVQGI